MKIKGLLNNTLSMFYPRLCAGCSSALRQSEYLLCLHCMLHLPETNYHWEHNNPLQHVFAGRVRVEEVAALAFYTKDTAIQHILHALKYNGQKEIGKLLGSYYGEKLMTQERFRSVDYILPIPLHPKKLRLRGYNQSEWIAMGLSESMHCPYLTDVLVRKEFTETQTKKNRFNRWQNVKEGFGVDNVRKIEGKHLLVCDDVLTTGATMEAAVQHLLTVENVKVSVVTLATAHH